MTVLLGAAPSIIGPSDVGAWMAAKGAPGAASALDFVAQKYGLRSPVGVPRWGSVAQDMVFARASAAGRWPASGPYEMIGSGVLRYDHDPITRTPLGVRLERAATNSFARSEEMTTTAWANAGTSRVDAGGGVVAVTEDTTNSYHGVGFNTRISFTAGVAYTLSIKAKLSVGTRRVRMFAGNNTIIVFNAVFDLVTGTVVSGAGATITPLGDGWYRLTQTLTAISTGTEAIIPACLAGPSLYYVGDGTSTILFRHPQIEVGAFASSYIATGASTVTRAGDNLSMILPVVPANGFTLAFRARMPPGQNAGDSNILFSIMQETGNAGRLDVDTFSGAGTIWFSRPANNTYRQLAAGLVAGAECRGAVSWSASRGYRGTVNGGAVVAANDAAPSAALTRVTLGSRAGSAQWGGTLHLPVFWPHGDFSDDAMRGLLA